MADGKEAQFSQQYNRETDITSTDENALQNTMIIPPFLQHQFQEMRGSFGFKDDSEFLLYLMRKGQLESRIPQISNVAPDQMLPAPNSQPLSNKSSLDPTHQVEMRDQNGQQVSTLEMNKQGQAAGSYLPQYSFIAKETPDLGSENAQFKANGIDLLARAAADIGVMRLDPSTGSFIAQPEAQSLASVSPYTALPSTGTNYLQPEESPLQPQQVINQAHQAADKGVLCESGMTSLHNDTHSSETFLGAGSATYRERCENKALHSTSTVLSNQSTDNKKHTIGEHKCFLCYKIFKTKQDQIKHVSNHTGTYKCQFCKKVFTKYCVFIFHQNMHNRKHYNCGKCSFKTFHSYALKRHILISHTRDRIDRGSPQNQLRSSKRKYPVKMKKDMKLKENDKTKRLRNINTYEEVKTPQVEVTAEDKIEEVLLENFLPAMIEGVSKLKKEISQPKRRGRQAKKTKSKNDSSILVKFLEKQLADLSKRIKKNAPKRSNIVQKRSSRKKDETMKTTEQKNIMQKLKACREILGLECEGKNYNVKFNNKSDEQLNMLKKILQTNNDERSDHQTDNGNTVVLDTNVNEDVIKNNLEKRDVQDEKKFKKEPEDCLPNKGTIVREKSRPGKKPDAKDKKLSCALCDEEFVDRMSLTRHAESHKNAGNLFSCKTCEVTSKSYYEIASHLNIHKTTGQVFACTHCIQAFPQRYLLNRHIKKKHSFLLDDEAKFDQAKGMKCPHCDVLFSHDHKLEEHIGAVHNDGTRAPRYICEICGASYHIKGSYRTHMRRHVGEDMKCPHCSYTSKYSGTLKEHIRLVHLNEHKYVCEECGRSFKRKRNIDEHRWSMHLHCKKFMCSYEGCGKTFGARRHLVVHQRIHTGEKPLKCQYCDFTCRQKNSINWHMKQHVNITGPLLKPSGKGRPKMKKEEIQNKDYNKKFKDKKTSKKTQQNIQANLVQMPTETMPTLSIQTSASTTGNLSQLVSALHQQEPLDFASNSMSFTEMAPAYPHTRQPISSFLRVIEPKDQNAASASNFLVVAQTNQGPPQTQMQAMPLGCVPLPHTQGIPAHSVVVSQQSHDTMATEAITSQPSSTGSQEGTNPPSYYSQEMMIAATTLAGQFYE